MSRRAAWRRFSSEPLEVGEPELDERANRVLEPSLPRDRERLLVALASLRGVDTLLEPIVTRDEKPLDSLARRFGLHIPSVTVQI
jgi:hypothetical protein